MATPGKDLRVIVAGGGTVGFRTAELLDERGHDVFVIEKDPVRCGELADAYVATVIDGDATIPSILRQAGPEDADVVAGLTNDVAANLAICMMAQQMNPSLHTVLRTDPQVGDAHANLVGAVIYPERASALLAVNAIYGGDVRSLEHAMGELEIIEVRVEEGAPAVGKSLEEISFPSGSLIVSDAAGSRVARPATVIEAGHHYIVAAEPSVTDEVMQLLRG
ncbi:potassium channel family protein [Salinibacter altiplanensis]|uniref:potassium channel family protein n=1 Tax=Salinibacter altiplanensis TaxID=1803181 RepID=UPI000C9EE1A8|nr:TrkA family potassium uptake protein [Salinibacter altiplanensis]